MTRKQKRTFTVVSCLIALPALFLFISYILLPGFFSMTYSSIAAQAGAAKNGIKKSEGVAHVAMPTPVKAIYMTSCVAGSKTLREGLVKIVDETEVNSIVIDIKDYTGTISYPSENPALKDFLSTRCHAEDMKQFIASLHEKGIYVIGRITVFQDPFLSSRRPELAVMKASDKTTWKDHKGLSFTDPGSKEVWDHNIMIAKDSYAIGFDELNFDYIRFPSDGNMKDIFFSHSQGRTKPDVLEDFFSYLHNAMKDTGAVISADLFGMTTTNTDDLNIGQVLEKAMPYFDYIAPMVYPSHYPPNFNGWKNPNEHPYDLIKFVMNSGVKRAMATSTIIRTLGSTVVASSTPRLYSKQVYSADKLRTWIQDFDYGGNYDIPEVKAQIQASYDAGVKSWMIWSPSNRYTVGALNKE